MTGSIDWTWFASVTAFAFAASATPGPNNTMLAASGANFGFRASAPHMAGVCIGFSAMMLLIGGVGLSIIRDPLVIALLRWIGAAYLLWLAWKIATADPASASDAPPEGRAKPLTFIQAALFQWVNPKAWTVAAGALATYAAAGPEGDSLALTFVITAIFALVSIPIIVGWTMLGMGAAHFLKSRRAMRTFNLAMAALLALSLAPTVVEGWRSDIAPRL